jgi:hypothetical protein
VHIDLHLRVPAGLTAIGTNAKCRLVRYLVALGGKADNICSFRAFPLLTHLGHPTDARDAPHNSRLTM